MKRYTSVRGRLAAPNTVNAKVRALATATAYSANHNPAETFEPQGFSSVTATSRTATVAVTLSGLRRRRNRMAAMATSSRAANHLPSTMELISVGSARSE
ncbi:hypothetical protein AHiyo1_27910 [Arthrobacter sp. Hiyo1]|nr:hypothetical protein AHiyo1_27910 [Arthrobacter sp. Hiyo1]